MTMTDRRTAVRSYFFNGYKVSNDVFTAVTTPPSSALQRIVENVANLTGTGGTSLRISGLMRTLNPNAAATTLVYVWNLYPVVAGLEKNWKRQFHKWTIIGILLIPLLGVGLGILIGVWFQYSVAVARLKQLQSGYAEQLSRVGLTEVQIKNKPIDLQVDQWLQEELKAVFPLALSKLGLEREELLREPLLIYGPLFWRTPGVPEADIVGIKGNDGIVRFSCYSVVVICLSDTRVNSYKANFNFIRNTFLGESTVEYVYRDIVSVSTEDRASNYDLPDGQILRHAQFFRLAVASGDSIEVALNSPEIRDLFGGDPAPTNHERTVQVIREMLREKKG